MILPVNAQNISNNIVQTEDRLIMKAILSDERGDINNSREIYKKLYQITANKDYLLQESRDTLILKANPTSSISHLLSFITNNPTDRDADLYRILVALYIQQGSLEDAEDVADEYLTENASIEDQIAVAILKVELNKSNEAFIILKKLYSVDENEDILMQISDIFKNAPENNISKNNLHNEIINMMTRHIKNHKNTSVGIYFKLIEMYAKEKKLDNVLALYKQLYHRNPQKYFLQKIIEVSLYLRDIDGIITFLEENDGNKDILFSFYKERGNFKKAIIVARQLYKNEKKPKWLAEEGILIYENEKKLHGNILNALDKMKTLMDKSIALGVNDPMYLNYYGYTLIEHDFNIDRGIKLVRKALSMSPNDIYYLDSLAWGLYKKGKCAQALKFMKVVVARDGLKEKEIKMHWDTIRQCSKK